jgi:mannose/cellobiose epimerase-like protein (N-acyl-D-glucosamine 2-epimerase family)
MSEIHLQKITAIADQANDWLTTSALPLWFERGVDWRLGGFNEALNLSDLTCPANYKRLRVLARQIYVFSVGSSCGQAYCKKAVTQGLDFLIHKTRLPTGGFASRLTIDGKIIDGPLDLYDLAFTLFALAHGYKLLADPVIKEEAIILSSFLLKNFKHDVVGFIESIPPSLPRRQNPHMHLLEALLEWRVISLDPIFADLSDEIIKLFFEKFYFTQSGAVIEYFDEDLIPIAGPGGEITEPGHHFEWMWLLSRYKSISGQSTREYSNLYEFCHRFGINPHNGFLWGEVNTAGAPGTHLVRLWPHTEWIKAELVGEDEAVLAERVEAAWKILSRFLDCPRQGLWYETFDHQQNVFLNEPAPASTLYHITLAIDTLNTYLRDRRSLA